MKKLILLLIAFFLLGYVPLYAFPPQPKVSGGAPIGAHYLVDLADGTLTAEVVVSANGKSLITAADYAGMKTLTGWYTATGDLDADLQTYAGITPSADVQSVLGCADEAAILTFLDLEAGTDFYSIASADAAFEAELNNSAGLLAALSDETGTGVAVFGTAPTFTTSITMGSAGLTEPELEILDGATLSTTQINYLNAATGTTGTNTTNLVYSESPTFTGTAIFATINVGTLVMDASATPQWVFRDSDNAGTDKEISKIYANATTVTDGTEDGDLFGQAMTNGSEKTGWKIDGDGVSSTQCSFQSYDEVQMAVVDWTTDTATGDGKFYFHIGPKLAGLNLVYCHAEVITAGTTNTTDIQIYNLTQTADMLSTKITIDTGETGSDTAATPYVIDAANDDVALNDVVRVDVDAVSTTAAKGLIITLGFAIP